jgi:signal transduction histidine kinase
MKVLNYTTSYLAAVLLVIISIWAGIFYYAMLDEIYDSIDDGLDNQKGLLLQKAAIDSTILCKSDFDEGDYAIREIPAGMAREFRDVYVDTLMYMQNEQDFEPVRLLRTVFLHKGNYYQLQVVTSMVEEDDLVTELFYALLWLYLGLIATILVLNNFILKRIWQPFYHLLKQVKNFRLEKPSIQLKQTNIDEFRLLNDAVQKMLQSNIDSYNSQKHLIENASHELQTPLAISIHKLEALAESDGLTGEQSALLGSALNNLQRLTRLNRSLLLLSKIENRQFVSEEEVNINELVKKSMADFADQASYHHLTVTLKEEGNLFIRMNPDLASILVINLLKNAIVHNHSYGFIAIEISKGSLSIANSGKKEALNEQFLFTRFSQQRDSQTSTGLGLSIVKAIADLFSFTIHYSYTGKHIIHLNFHQQSI